MVTRLILRKILEIPLVIAGRVGVQKLGEDFSAGVTCLHGGKFGNQQD